MEFDAVSFGAGALFGAICMMVLRAIAHKPSSSKPHLIYFPIAGRGEISRMIAVAGGLDIKETTSGDDRKPYTDNKAAYGSPSGLPLLEHGNLKISQSAAIATYLATLAPQFAGLTSAHRATDNMFLSIKEDM